MSLNVNVITVLEFELGYSVATIQQFNHYATSNPPPLSSFPTETDSSFIPLSYLINANINKRKWTE